MLIEIRCPKCNKFVAKRGSQANTSGIYFYCTRCKENFEIKNNSALVADKNK